MKRNLIYVLVIVSAMLMCSGSMFGQAAQKSASQSHDGR